MILHVDMDAFYASIEERERPELAGKPLIVGGTPQGRGVVAAANYAAREYGVHSAMSAARARHLCPHATFLRPRMQLYAQVGSKIREIFHRYTPLVEPLSLDEAFLDVAGCEALFGNAETIGRRIRDDIASELRLAASVGVAPNKFLAKIASDLKKPNGFVVVPPDGVQEFLDPLPVGRLWGVGRASGRVFDKIGVHTIGQLRRLPEDLLVDHFVSHGTHLARLARGIDDRRVVPDRVAKSISHETTFPQNVCDPHILEAWLLDLTELGCGLAEEARQSDEPRERAADDAEHQWKTEPGRPDHRLRAPSDAGPHRDRTRRDRGLEHLVGERGPEPPGPCHGLVPQQPHQEVELLIEQRLVVGEVEAEEGEGLDRRATPDDHLRASCRDRVQRRELVVHAHGVLSAEHRHRGAETQRLGARGDRGQYHRRGGVHHAAAIVFGDSERVQSRLLGGDGLLDDVAQHLRPRHRVTVRVVVLEGERPDSEVQRTGTRIAHSWLPAMRRSRPFWIKVTHGNLSTIR